jgi:hypothetical protein
MSARMEGRYFFSSACSYWMYRSSVGNSDAVVFSTDLSAIIPTGLEDIRSITGGVRYAGEDKLFDNSACSSSSSSSHHMLKYPTRLSAILQRPELSNLRVLRSQY